MIDRSAAARRGQHTVQATRASNETSKAFQLGSGPPTAARAAATAQPPTAVARTLADLETQRQNIDRLLDQAARGRHFSPAQLLRLQTTVYRYAQDLELLSRVVDRTVGALKTTLNTQV